MTAEELLMMSDDVETYIADDALVIDPESRTILTPVNGLILGVESDKEAERVQFVCPRFVGDNIDLSELQIRTIYQNANGEKDFRISTDVSVDGDNIRFSWLLSRNVTKYKGKVKFIVCAIRTQADGTTKNEWNTTLAEGISLEGLEVDILEEEFEEPKDIVLQLLGMFDEKATEIMGEIDKYLEKLKIDNNLDVNSENAIQNKVAAKQFNRLSEENAELKSDLESLIDKSLNLITELNYGYTYGSDSESIAESASNIITNLIEVELNTNYIIYTTNSEGTRPYTRIVTYKSDGSFSSVNNPTTIGVDHDDGSCTVSFSTSNLKFDKIRILTLITVDTSTITYCKADDWNGVGLPITGGDKIKEDKLPESYHNLLTNAIQSTGITVTDSTSEYYDANNIKENIVVRYGGAGNNVPSSSGTLLSFTGSTVGGMTHLFIARSGKMYYRTYWNNVWTEWALVNTSNIEPYCSFALFETIGVVGDSYASGASGESSSATTAVDHNNISWCQMLARRNGVDVANYTKGGLSTRTWLTNSTVGLTKLLSDNPKGLYILALIRNDYNIENNGETGYIGSIADITEYNLGSYPDSFYGNYATIIERIQNHAPNAKIVLMTGDYVSSNELGTSYNNAVEEIAGHYNLPCMVQLEDEFFSTFQPTKRQPAFAVARRVTEAPAAILPVLSRPNT